MSSQVRARSNERLRQFLSILMRRGRCWQTIFEQSRSDYLCVCKSWDFFTFEKLVFRIMAGKNLGLKKRVFTRYFGLPGGRMLFYVHPWTSLCHIGKMMTGRSAFKHNISPILPHYVFPLSAFPRCFLLHDCIMVSSVRHGTYSLVQSAQNVLIQPNKWTFVQFMCLNENDRDFESIICFDQYL